MCFGSVLYRNALGEVISHHFLVCLVFHSMLPLLKIAKFLMGFQQHKLQCLSTTMVLPQRKAVKRKKGGGALNLCR